jgi:ABC-type enterochelin transport system permease subunit
MDRTMKRKVQFAMALRQCHRVLLLISLLLLQTAYSVAQSADVREIGGSLTEIVTVNYSRILARNIDETLGLD